MSSEFQKSVILITSSDTKNNNFGSGFVIYQNEHLTYLLTCAHVVRDVGGENLLKVGDTTAKVIASGTEAEIDLAVLGVKGLSSKEPLILCTYCAKGNSFVVAGFQSLDRELNLIRPIRGNLGEPIELQSKKQIGRIKGWDLKINGDYKLQPGYSGSPLIDETSGYAIGVVSHRLEEGQKGVAISIEALKDIWPEMPSHLIQESGPQSVESTSLNKGIEVFICYCQEDEELLKQLETSFSNLTGQGFIRVWHQGNIRAGDDKNAEINKHLNSARLIVILISGNFMKYYYNNFQNIKSQVDTAMKRKEAGKAIIIPVLLTKVASLETTIFGQMKFLPNNGKPVKDRYWRNRNEVFDIIAEELGKEINLNNQLNLNK